MKRVLMMAGALVMLGMPVSAQDASSEISATLPVNSYELYSFATSKTQKNGAIGGSIDNLSDKDLKIVRAESPVAERVELHTHLEEDGVMKMREVEAYDIDAFTDIHLEPGGPHIMLFDLKKQLVEGEFFTLRLFDENGASMELPVRVRAAGDVPKRDTVSQSHGDLYGDGEAHEHGEGDHEHDHEHSHTDSHGDSHEH